MILITGFEPFGNDTENPSRLAAAAAVAMLEAEGIPATFLEVPVVFATAGPTVLAKVKELNKSTTSPSVDVVICVGVANGRKAVTPESVAYNGQQGKDNAGDEGHGKIIDADEVEQMRKTRLPIRAAVKAIGEAGIPVEISHNAGRYVCNTLMYETLAGFDGVAGFVHVPSDDMVSIKKQAQALVLVAKSALKVVRGETEPEEVIVEEEQPWSPQSWISEILSYWMPSIFGGVVQKKETPIIP